MRASGRTSLALAASLAVGCHRRPGGPPYEPAESLATMRLQPGLRIEVFASEPAVASPVAMEFDEHGRLFVVEMPGYPLDTRPTGRVKLLEDRDRDGRYESSTVFADGLVLPTGVMRWRGGILVTAAPDVWYLEDTDGDRRADVKRRMLTGFAFTNPQHTVNGPVYGLDNWIYLAHEGPAEAIVFKDRFGDRGTGVRFADGEAAPALDADRRSVRFRLEPRSLEALSGRSQFGHAFDDYGRYFTLDNSNHARHVVIAARYLRRNPDLLLASAMQDASDHGAAATVFPITRGARFEMLSEPGQFTSACSLTFVPGGPLRGVLGHSSVVAEPVHNLVHRDVWSPSGSTFAARRAEERREFLAAEDAWFRPVNFATGPDDALFIVDYYRPHIEHPEWAAEHHHHDSPALYQGSDRGRIYRVTAASHPAAPPRLPGGAATGELVAMLSHPNAWWRRHAQRLLVDRRPAEAPPMLARIAREGPSATGRVHALWTLEGLGQLTADMTEAALGDPDPGVRENAIVLAERFLPAARALQQRLLAMAGDADARVRFQLACTLAGFDSPTARAAQERLLAGGMEDRWMQVALLSGSSDRAAAWLERGLRATGGLIDRESPGRAGFLRDAAGVVAARRRPHEIGPLVERVARASETRDEWWRAAVLDGLARALRRTRGGAAVPATARLRLLALAESRSPAVRGPALDLLGTAGVPEGPPAQAAFARAAARAGDRRQDANARADAIALAALGRPGPPLPPLVRLVDPQEPEPVQVAAVKAMRASAGEEAGRFLLSRWRTFTPAVRAEAAEALLSDPRRTRQLLAAIADGTVQPWTLGFWHKRDLLMHDDPAVRTEAHRLLEERPGEREQVLRRYEAALDRAPDARRGEQVFREACAKCHRFQGVGADVGPDLGTVANRPASLLLKDVLMPSLSIAPRYESYVVERVSGGTEEGVLAAQTPTTVVLRREGGHETVIPRDDVRSLRVSQLSAMPADLEQQVSEQQMADLLRYLTSAR